MTYRKFTVEFLIEQRELDAAHERRMEDGKQDFDQPDTNMVYALALDLQEFAYDYGSMHGHFVVLDVSEPLYETDAEMWHEAVKADPNGGKSKHPMEELNEVLQMLSAGNYKSSYEGKIIDKLENAIMKLKGV